MMERRTFARLAAGGLLGAVLAAGAQQTARVWRIGFLAKGARPPDGAAPAALRKALQALGSARARTLCTRVAGPKHGTSGFQRLPPS